MLARKKERNRGTVTANLVAHCLWALLGAAVTFAVALYLLASWSSGDFWPFDNGAQIPWEPLARLALPVTALLGGILGAVIAGHGQATRIEELRNSRDADVTERYTKAIEQLGSTQTAIRVGGIFALERIGHDSERDRTTVVNVLTASLFRELDPAGEKPGTPVVMAKAEESALMVALMRLRRRGERDKLGSYLWVKPSFENADLREAYLADSGMSRFPLMDANLSKADLSGASLRWALLFGANLTGANLKHADLSQADAMEADFSGADLTSATLKDADLPDTKFDGATLKSANLQGAKLEGASFIGADLIGADLTGADLTGTNFSGAKLRDVQIDGNTANCGSFTREQLRVMQVTDADSSPAIAESRNAAQDVAASS
ncbi:uncharacterized protein YjbI with pentapeptide repeats [Paenarthrobacter nicotinovorans]|uniref:Uncharacterized protein YjbI with pentapeptide repeats n=2 Tax=Paenarthrobacter nicotinovorans TaxID=29320 RepID=A0ABT9TRY4_PAENI|nr:uncharacterized protein YjbI with pentapeptide repeats [Paenarthrobacter nicotinovorans]